MISAAHFEGSRPPEGRSDISHDYLAFAAGMDNLFQRSSHGFSFQGDFIDVADQAVQDAVDKHQITDYLMPIGDAQPLIREKF